MQNRSAGNAQGIDVSRYQGQIDWTKVRNDGISFVFVKATEGETGRDPYFARNAEGAAAAGLLVGAYHFMRATTPDGAIREAQHFYQTVSASAKLQLPPVMDYEQNNGGLKDADINKVAKAFLSETERLFGVRPILYSGNSFASHFDASLGAYPLWVARYSTTAPVNVTAWSAWTFWQYSGGDSGGTRPGGGRRVAGISTPVDLNEYAGTEAQLRETFAPDQEGQPMTEAERQEMDQLKARIAKLESYLNLSGNQMPPAWINEAAWAAKQAGIITSINDKGNPEFISIQMLYNAGLCNPELIAFFKQFSAGTREAIEALLAE
ncbi:glycoside hydrolase family 25 protein [Paenibacillus protaetiae]|uniref:1,4-beta-N-acetylmuramidase n=1 Tax=Paenibacillus protaetiae TaxID=2509456 RepID=A0A4P6EY47_9BACL|nr:glycoside hydrolase family 25 protein [Paenibacillus protaetiae]QAY65557.1 1,4-beta-N-acetylmuramidase [Paenibacillus protaetiae]